MAGSKLFNEKLRRFMRKNFENHKKVFTLKAKTKNSNDRK